MNEMQRRIKRIRSDAGRALAFQLYVQADLVQEFSNDPNNLNVSAWLRSGALDMIERIEEELSELYY